MRTLAEHLFPWRSPLDLPGRTRSRGNFEKVLESMGYFVILHKATKGLGPRSSHLVSNTLCSKRLHRASHLRRIAKGPATQVSGQQYDLTIVEVTLIGRLHFANGSCRLASKVAIPLKSIITAGISTDTSVRTHYCYQTTKTSLPI